MGFGSFLRKAAPVIGAGIGAAIGGPAGAKIGYSVGSTASKIGEKKPSGGSQMTQPVVHSSVSAPPPQPTLPMSAGSLAQARSQDKSRLRHQYPGLGND